MNKYPEIDQLIHLLDPSVSETLVKDDDAIAKAYGSLQTKTSGTTLKILSVVGGVLSTLAFISFIMSAGLYESKLGMVIFGIALIITAILLLKSGQQLIVDTFCVSFFVFGCCLFGFGMHDLHISEKLLSVLFIVIAGITIVMAKAVILDFLSLMLIAGSILSLIFNADVTYMIHVYNVLLAVTLYYTFSHEARIYCRKGIFANLYDSMLPALIVAFAAGLCISGIKGLVHGTPWLASVPAAVCIILIMLQIQKVLASFNLLAEKNSWKINVLVAVVLAPTIMNPAIAGSLLIVLLSFYINYKTGLGLGIVAFIYFVSQYYYDLQFSLLTKSIMLFASGIFFLLLYLFVSQKSKSYDAH